MKSFHLDREIMDRLDQIVDQIIWIKLSGNLKSKYSNHIARSQTLKLKIFKIQHNFGKESNLKSKYSNYFAKNQTLNQNIPNILQGVKPQKSKY